MVVEKMRIAFIEDYMLIEVDCGEGFRRVLEKVQGKPNWREYNLKVINKEDLEISHH